MSSILSLQFEQLTESQGVGMAVFFFIMMAILTVILPIGLLILLIVALVRCCTKDKQPQQPTYVYASSPMPQQQA